MICAKCGEPMDQTDKNSFSGRVIREYLCRKCGHTDWEDDGVALWQVLHDAREKDEAEAAANSAANPAPPTPASAAPAQPSLRSNSKLRASRLAVKFRAHLNFWPGRRVAATRRPPRGVPAWKPAKNRDAHGDILAHNLGRFRAAKSGYMSGMVMYWSVGLAGALVQEKHLD